MDDFGQMSEEEATQEEGSGKASKASVAPVDRGEAAYLRDRESYIDTEASAAASFDKLAPVIAAGALGLSLTFIKDIAPHPPKTALPVVGIAWALLVFSVASSLASRLLAQYAFRRMVHICDDDRREELGDKRRIPHKQNPCRSWANFANWATLVALAAGLSFLACFAYLSIVSE